MLQSEFEKLVGMRVSPQEYNAIEEVYTASDMSVSKTEFCNYWCKLNKARIKAYKAKVREQEKRNKIVDKIYNLISCLIAKREGFAVEVLSKSQKVFLEKNWIEYKKDEYGPMLKSTLIYNLKKEINALV